MEPRWVDDEQRARGEALLAAWAERGTRAKAYAAAVRAARFGPVLQAGEIVADRYRLLAWAGDGPLGATWSAWDLDEDQPITLKTLHGQHATDPAARAAFDAAAASAVAGPALRSVRDSGGTWEGFRWFAIDGSPGITLTDRVTSGSLGPTAALEAVLDAARGLSALHAAGLVHGLVQPDAIRITEDGAAWLHDAGLSTAGSAAGTPWLAPERLDPSAVPDRAADVYGLAMTVLYALNGGDLPFWAWRSPERLVEQLAPPAPASGALKLAVGWDPKARGPGVDALIEGLLGARALRRSLASGALELGRPAAALTHLDALLAGAPTDPDLLVDRARALDGLDDPGATAAWLELLAAHRTRDHARLARHALVSRTGGAARVEHGLALLDLVAPAERPPLQLQIGRVLLDELGKRERALPLLQAALEGGAGDAELSELVERLRTERGDWDDALRHLERRARDADGGEDAARQALEIARFATRGDRSALLEALLTHTDDPEALRSAIARATDAETALARIGQLERTGAETAHDVVIRATWLGRDGRGAEARTALAAALERWPGHLGLRAALGRQARSLGLLDEAWNQWTGVLDALDGVGFRALQAEGRHALAELAWIAGDARAAALHWHALLDGDPLDRTAWWGLARAALRAPADAPWIGATPAVFTPEEALARLLAGTLDPDALIAWLAASPRSAPVAAAVASLDNVVRAAAVVDQLQAAHAIGPALFAALDEACPEASLATEAVRWLWCEPAAEPLFAITDCYRWSGTPERFDPRVERRVLHLPVPRTAPTAADADHDSLVQRAPGPLPIEAAWVGGTPAMASERAMRLVVVPPHGDPLELVTPVRRTAGGGAKDDLPLPGQRAARLAFEPAAGEWYVVASPAVVVDGAHTTELRLRGGERIAVDGHGLRVLLLPVGAAPPAPRSDDDDLELDLPEAWPDDAHAILIVREGSQEEVIAFTGDTLALDGDPDDPVVPAGRPFLFRLQRTREGGYTLEDRSGPRFSELPAVLPLQHGDTFAIGDRTFTFEVQGIDEIVPALPRADAPVPLLVYRDEDGSETILPLLDDVFSIGRGQGNDLQLSGDVEVSRHHCMIIKGTDGACILRDGGSANGTWVDGRSIERHILQVGEVIQIGAARLEFRLGRREDLEANIPDLVLEEVEETTSSRADTAAFQRPVRRT